MSDQTALAKQKFEQWAADMEALNLPDWNALPNLELYMDQVVLLLTQYLTPLTKGQDEKYITASIVNNYVRMKIIPPPVKKKYARPHLACLIMICMLKQSLSISCIQQILPAEQSEEAVRLAYTDFVLQMRKVTAAFTRQIRISEELMPTAEGSNLAVSSAIIATLSKSLTEQLLQTSSKNTKS